MFWDFCTTDINFHVGGNDKLVCSMQRNSIGQQSSHKKQATSKLLQENHLFASVAPSEDDQNGPRSDASSLFSHMLTDKFFAMA